MKFFPKNNKAGEDYDGGRDVDDFVKFINEKCGTSRDAKGQLTSQVSGCSCVFTLLILYIAFHNYMFLSFQAGVVESLDALVKEFVAAANDERKAILSRIEEEVEKLEGSSARYFIPFLFFPIIYEVATF